MPAYLAVFCVCCGVLKGVLIRNLLFGALQVATLRGVRPVGGFTNSPIVRPGSRAVGNRFREMDESLY